MALDLVDRPLLAVCRADASEGDVDATPPLEGVDRLVSERPVLELGRTIRPEVVGSSLMWAPSSQGGKNPASVAVYTDII
jgi:hypothetical protein